MNDQPTAHRAPDTVAPAVTHQAETHVAKLTPQQAIARFDVPAAPRDPRITEGASGKVYVRFNEQESAEFYRGRLLADPYAADRTREYPESAPDEQVLRAQSGKLAEYAALHDLQPPDADSVEQARDLVDEAYWGKPDFVTELERNTPLTKTSVYQWIQVRDALHTTGTPAARARQAVDSGRAGDVVDYLKHELAQGYPLAFHVAAESHERAAILDHLTNILAVLDGIEVLTQARKISADVLR